jgi:glycosyltransferase involved in cell wall biosynthesis
MNKFVRRKSMKNHQIAYISFDTVPSPKGASTHIQAFLKSLSEVFKDIDLITVSPHQNINYRHLLPNVKQTELSALGKNFIHRVLYFRNQLLQTLHNKKYKIIHIRSIFEGFPIALNKEKYCDYLIFEVNGLPSIELKYRYPNVVEDRELCYKIEQQEYICLEKADLIITPSQITKEFLISKNINSEKIKVISNGVDLDIFQYNNNLYTGEIHNFKLLYFGTFSPWQGVNLAIDAVALANKDINTKLTIIGQGKSDQIENLNRKINKYQMMDQIKINAPVSQSELVKIIHQHSAIIAPLTPNDRNLIQGCCPLKILESMATGIPIIASDLPVVRELGNNEEHFLLFKPNSSKSIKDNILRLKFEPKLKETIVKNAREKIENNYTWEIAGKELIKVYQHILS